MRVLRILLSGVALAALLSLAVAFDGSAVGQPVELGAVRWERDFARAEAAARQSNRPLFALFQEVPGCQTCVSFGERVLSHPLLVEAIETEFVPVAVYNNEGGADRALLERFGEPSWNNPVVRFLDAEGRDLLPRADRVWEPHAVGLRMLAALEKAGRPVPAYLRVAVDELRPRAHDYATFSMHCFWSGEACLGGAPGVLDTRAAFANGREVVEVKYDPAEASYRELLAFAKRGGCVDGVVAQSAAQFDAAREVFGSGVERARGVPRAAPPADQKRQLRGTRYAELDLTPRQAARVNAAVGAGRSPAPHLSPRQRAAAGH